MSRLPSRAVRVGAVCLVQLALVGAAVAGPLSARLTGQELLLEVEPVDPIDPFRGAYVDLDYPDRHQTESIDRIIAGLGTMRNSLDLCLYKESKRPWSELGSFCFAYRTFHLRRTAATYHWIQRGKNLSSMTGPRNNT